MQLVLGFRSQVYEGSTRKECLEAFKARLILEVDEQIAKCDLADDLQAMAAEVNDGVTVPSTIPEDWIRVEPDERRS